MSASSRVAVIVLMVGGVLMSIAGTCVATVARRPEITLRALFWAGSDAAAHPERYVKPELLGAVRAVSLLGVGLFATGALILAFHAIAGLI
jgi:hypothetical protein